MVELLRLKRFIFLALTFSGGSPRGGMESWLLTVMMWSSEWVGGGGKRKSKKNCGNVYGDDNFFSVFNLVVRLLYNLQCRKGMGRWNSRSRIVGSSLFSIEIGRRYVTGWEWHDISVNELNFLLISCFSVFCMGIQNSLNIQNEQTNKQTIVGKLRTISRSAAYEELASTIARTLQAQRRFDAKIS